MMEASSRGGVRTWPNQVVTPSSSILHLSWKWNILYLHQKMESFKRRSASLIPLQWMLGAHRQLTGYYLRHPKWDGKPGCYANCFSLEKLEDIFIQKKASLVNVTFSFLATDKRLGLRQLKRKQVRSAVFDFTKRHCSKNEFQANAWQVWEQFPPIIST